MKTPPLNPKPYKNLLEVPTPWPKQTRTFNQQLISKRLIELAKAGTYFDSRLLP